MEIEVGEYVRTIDGYIRKIDNVNTDKKEITYRGKYILDIPYKNSQAIAINKILKHSFNIIDLIEVDDIGIMNCYGLKVKKFITKDDILELKCRNYELLSIITKEQIKQIEYRIKE